MYVVLGATGHIGSVAAHVLLAKGEKVRAVARSTDKLAALSAKGADIFAAEFTDVTGLTKALTGAKAAFLMAPAPIEDPDIIATVGKITDAITEAVRASGIGRVVLLSSIGAQHDSKTGPIINLHRFEKKLETISGLSATFLRPTFFMENLLMTIPLIQNMGFMAGGIEGDKKLPMIATRDIGEVVAEVLTSEAKPGIQIRELLGPRDVSHDECAKAVGAEIGKPNLSYQSFPGFMVKQALKQMGMPDKSADLMNELNDAANDGLLTPLMPRSTETNTPTSIETFAKEVFAPAYNAKSAKA